jgi:hypothetical protein
MWDNDKFIDDLLSSSLHATATPRQGLEERIFTNLASAQPQPKLGWLTFPRIAFASAACIALVFAIWGMRHLADTRNPAVARIESASISVSRTIPPAPVTVTKTAALQKPSLTPARMRPAPARAETFPARAELSEQERLVLAYLRRTPRSEVAFNSKPDPPDDSGPVEMNLALPAQHSTSEVTK